MSAPLHGYTPPPTRGRPLPPPRPEADTPREQTLPLSTAHAGRYGQQVGGMHPTGMHTYFKIFFNNSQCFPCLENGLPNSLFFPMLWEPCYSIETRLIKIKECIPSRMRTAHT